MPIRATRISPLLGAVLAGVMAVQAQSPDAGGATPPATTNAAPSAIAPAAGPAPVDAAATTLDYIFNRKPQDGSAAQAVSAVGNNVGDKLKGSDVLGTSAG